MAFAFSSIDDREIDGCGLGSGIGAVAEYDFAKDYRVAQRLFGMIVGWGHPIYAQKGEEAVVLALGVEQALAKVFGFWMCQGFAANAVELSIERSDLRFGVSEAHFAFVPVPAQIAGLRKEFAQLELKSKRLVF